MRIIESDRNDNGQRTYLLEKGNATGTLIIATVIGPAKIRFRYLLSGKPVTIRDNVQAFRLVSERETNPTASYGPRPDMPEEF